MSKIRDKTEYTVRSSKDHSDFGFYCKFGNFCENIVFAKSVKRHICNVKNWRLGHDLPTSVNNIVIYSFCDGFILAKLHICEVSRK